MSDEKPLSGVGPWRPIRVLETLTVDLIVIECPACRGRSIECNHCSDRGKVVITSERSIVGCTLVWDQRR